MRYPPVKLRALGAVGCVAALAALAACSSSSTSASGTSTGSSSTSGTITVAVVSNPLITGQMIPLTTSNFEKMYPGIKVKFATYTEGDLRAAIEKDVATHSNAFNVIMIGPYEAPLFAKNGWLTNLSTQYIASDPSYDAPDLLPSISKALSYNGSLYAAPFYGESSMLYYRKDLFKAAGLTMPLHPTWAQVASLLRKRPKIVGPGQHRELQQLVLLEVVDQRRPTAHVGLLQRTRGAVADHRRVVLQSILDGVVDAGTLQNSVAREPHSPATGVCGGAAELLGGFHKYDVKALPRRGVRTGHPARSRSDDQNFGVLIPVAVSVRHRRALRTE